MNQEPNLTPSRYASRTSHDRSEAYALLDEAQVCHVAFTTDEQPYCLPIGFHRDGDKLYLHGSAKSHFLSSLAEGKPLCIAATVLDGLVLAKSAFNHSMNYRSVAAFGRGSALTDPAEKMKQLELFFKKYLPGRWEHVRQPSEGELKATLLVEVPMEAVSLKQRSGPPSDERSDMNLPVWAGVYPMGLSQGEPIEGYA